MRRTLAAVLSFVIMIAALTGCVESQNSSDSEKKNGTLDTSIPLSMTIAETLPSCPAFEYRETDKAYCFYAYDTEGSFYRVIWNDFAGLSEKDPIVVAFSDVKKLTYDAYPSGWTPQYEITATRVVLESNTAVTLRRYAWDGWRVDSKDITGTAVAEYILNALANMKETGENVGKLSNDVLGENGDVPSGGFPVERGTLWIETEDAIYRLTPDLSQICRVETHFGKGRVLEMSEEFETDVRHAWYYSPYDYYQGTYHSGDKTVELKRVFAADSSVELRVKKIQVQKSDFPKNTITVELISKVDQTVTINLHCQQSNDNLAAGDIKTVELKKGVAKTVKLSFGGWKKYSYWVYMKVDNTKVEIMIEP